ncbi:MAG TPA: VOC family protein [Thermoplasmata archaeon]|nr:VOC family protein [Thermoplasmata archaeon]
MNASGNRNGRPEPPAITTFLTFSGAQYGKAEEAIRFYVSLFPDSNVEYLERHGAGEHVPVGELRRAAFTLAGQRFMATESQDGDRFAFTPAYSLYVDCRSEEQLRSLFTGLSKGGKVHMPLGPYPSSRLFVWFDDKYGVSWQLELAKSAAREDTGSSGSTNRRRVPNPAPDEPHRKAAPSRSPRTG